MSKSATESQLRETNRQLRQEKLAHAKTRTELQQEISRVWRLVPGQMIDLMGVYPPLRKLLHVLAEAAELQDPSRSSPVEDTMRVDFVNVGENASTSSTEQAVLTHRKHRQDVRFLQSELEHLRKKFREQLEYKTHRLGQLIAGSEWSYDLPEKPVCHRRECRKRGVKQSYTAWWDGCAGCGRTFEVTE